MNPRYPVYIPSKGRWERPLTARLLRSMGVPFSIVVEPTEEREYVRALGSSVCVLPFHDLGQGSIPARNWIWEHAISKGHRRHWIIDDNIVRFYRMNHNRRIPVSSGTIFRCAEDFVDRYENVGLAGFNNIAFAPDRDPNIPAFVLNTRIYSVTLIDTSLAFRWRGKYNEDTDLSLRILKKGLVTVQFNAFLADKCTTMTMSGGNTDTVYATNDHRREFAESLRLQHPDVVDVVWKFGRWHHRVDYRPFRRNALKRRPGIVPTGGCDNYGMRLRRVTNRKRSVA